MEAKNNYKVRVNNIKESRILIKKLAQFVRYNNIYYMHGFLILKSSNAEVFESRNGIAVLVIFSTCLIASIIDTTPIAKDSAKIEVQAVMDEEILNFE